MGQWYTWVIAIVLGVGLGLLMNRNKQTNLNVIYFLNKKDFYDNMRKGQLVDIQKKEDHEENKIKGSRNFKASSLTAKYSKLRKDKSVYMYCKNGKKSKRVAKKMSREGYTAIYILEGGIENT